MKIVIIGAGVMGLSCALDLLDLAGKLMAAFRDACAAVRRAS